MSKHSDYQRKWLKEAIRAGHIICIPFETFDQAEIIARGAFGEVSRAYWKSAEKTVALKSLYNNPVIGSEGSFEEFVRELQLIRSVDFHDNVIRFYGVSEDLTTQRYFMVLQYANGGNLRDFLSKNHSLLNWETRINMASQIASGLKCIHERNIVHRDLHSKNILVHDGKMMITDFGLSKSLDNNENSVVGGMVGYIEPQCFINSTYKRDKASDIYSLGVLLWEISSGRPPFNNMAILDIARDVVQGKREAPIKDSPPAYVAIYQMAWDIDPRKRPTINKVREDLEKLQSNGDADNLSLDTLSIHSQANFGVPNSNEQKQSTIPFGITESMNPNKKTSLRDSYIQSNNNNMGQLMSPPNSNEIKQNVTSNSVTDSYKKNPILENLPFGVVSSMNPNISNSANTLRNYLPTNNTAPIPNLNSQNKTTLSFNIANSQNNSQNNSIPIPQLQVSQQNYLNMPTANPTGQRQNFPQANNQSSPNQFSTQNQSGFQRHNTISYDPRTNQPQSNQFPQNFAVMTNTYNSNLQGFPRPQPQQQPPPPPQQQPYQQQQQQQRPPPPQQQPYQQQQQQQQQRPPPPQQQPYQQQQQQQRPPPPQQQPYQQQQQQQRPPPPPYQQQQQQQPPPPPQQQPYQQRPPSQQQPYRQQQPLPQQRPYQQQPYQQQPPQQQPYQQQPPPAQPQLYYQQQPPQPQQPYQYPQPSTSQYHQYQQLQNQPRSDTLPGQTQPHCPPPAPINVHPSQNPYKCTCADILTKYVEEYQNTRDFIEPDGCHAGYHAGMGDVVGLRWHLYHDRRVDGNYNFSDMSDKLVLITAKFCGRKNLNVMFQCLKEYGASFEVTTKKKGRTAFHLLFFNLELNNKITYNKEKLKRYHKVLFQAIKFLKEMRCNINAKDEDGRTVLSYFLGEKFLHDERSPIIEALLDNEADPNIPVTVNDWGEFDANTALLQAVRNKWSTSILEKIVKHGVNVKAINKEGMNALAIATQAKDTFTMTWMLENIRIISEHDSIKIAKKFAGNFTTKEYQLLNKKRHKNLSNDLSSYSSTSSANSSNNEK
ncbi:hypothetical protein C1645_80532 [Glomus cerebriforme]|uniref:Protein kinase domain-containing protein n=1 Tax=Glomus cerebriforme TaxID=658196 RepID=A0A397S1L2_9GLOM|nr:hypothetical protein C1645_80532 [Glomus cerebriforme]